MELAERVKKILRESYLCNECLGRQFRELNLELRNEKIGALLRNFAELEAKYKGESLDFKKSGKCLLCENLYEKIDSYIERVIEKLKDYEYHSFLIGSKLPSDILFAEEEFWEEHGIDLCEAIKTSFNRELSERMKLKTRKKIDIEDPDVMIIVDFEKDEIRLQISPLYLKGGYKKLKAESKPQELVEEISIKKSLAESSSFHSVGRLEQNVTTSCYRPFIVRLNNPKKRKISLIEVRKLINRSKNLNISKLAYSNREEHEKMEKTGFSIIYEVELSAKKAISRKDRLEFKKRVKNLSKKRVMQILKQKTRNPLILKASAKTSERKINLVFEATSGFSINAFLEGNSKPNFKNLLEVDFKIKHIVIKKYTELKEK